MYILVATSCCIYELTLGGPIVELVVPPILYITIIGSWTYAVLCIYSYFVTLKYEKRPIREKKLTEETDSTVTKPLVIDLREITIQKKVFPRNIWDDGSSVSNFSQKSPAVSEVPSNPAASTRV